MEENAKKKYALYALPLTTQNILTAAGERFSRATPTPEPGYVLIYTCGEKPQGSQEITAERANMLSAADARWLLDSGAALAAEELEKHKKEALQGLSESVEALEAELQRKKEQLSNRE